MNRELLIVIEQIGREKGIDKETLFEALESALLSASRKTLGAAENVRMEIDRHTGALKVFGRKKVVEEVTDNKLEISLADAKALNPEAELEDELAKERQGTTDHGVAQSSRISRAPVRDGDSRDPGGHRGGEGGRPRSG